MAGLVGDTKRQIIAMLAEEPNYEYQLAQELDISQPSVHQHLNDLKESGVVRTEERGDRTYYLLNDTGERFHAVMQEIAQYRTSDD